MGKSSGKTLNVDEFLKGQQDCKAGIPHKDGSDSYNRGYSSQYECEQVATALTENKYER